MALLQEPGRVDQVLHRERIGHPHEIGIDRGVRPGRRCVDDAEQPDVRVPRGGAHEPHGYVGGKRGDEDDVAGHGRRMGAAGEDVNGRGHTSVVIASRA